MTILLLGDITGRSRVALRMLSAVLEGCGHEVLMLPTALISNTLDLGRHAQLDTTDYLLRSLETWKALGMRYDLAYIGYITGMEQAEALLRVMEELRAQGVPVVVDPILGDNGRKYNSVTAEQAEGMKRLCGKADLITPNLTEACLLLGLPYEGADAREIVRWLSSGGRSTLVTSAKTEDGCDAVLGYDAKQKKEVEVRFRRVEGHHWGTGDLFTGLLMDAMLRGCTLEEAAGSAAAHVEAQLLGKEKSMLPKQ